MTPPVPGWRREASGKNGGDPIRPEAWFLGANGTIKSTGDKEEFS